MIEAIIIDDSTVNRQGLRHLIEQNCPQVSIIDEAGSSKDGAKLIDRLKPDLVFLDIELGDGTGFNVLENTQYTDFNIVFVTAYENYAVEAFKTKACSYILKPVQIPDLIQAVEQAIELIPRLSEDKLNCTHSDVIAISTQSELVFINKDDLIRCEADGKYTRCVLKDRVIMASKNLKEFEGILEEPDFIRIHHSHLISSAKVMSFNRSEYTVLLSNGDTVPVSQRKRDVITSAFKIV